MYRNLEGGYAAPVEWVGAVTVGEGSQAGEVAVFGDLSVRVEGVYRKFAIFLFL